MTEINDEATIRSELVAVRRQLSRLEGLAGLEQPGQQAGIQTGFRLVNPGDVVQADDHNLVMSQTVSLHASAAARSAAITAPVLNMMTARADAPGVIEYWNGSAWMELTTSIRSHALVTFSLGAFPSGLTTLKNGSAITGGGVTYTAATGAVVVSQAGLYIVSLTTGCAVGASTQALLYVPGLFEGSLATASTRSVATAVVKLAANDTLFAKVQNSAAINMEVASMTLGYLGRSV